MKPLLLTFALLFFVVSGVHAASEPAPLLPESLAARDQLAANQKTTTIFLKENDPVKATELLNTTNEEYNKQGWTLFGVLTFIRDEDFQGFFVTYQKNLVIN